MKAIRVLFLVLIFLIINSESAFSDNRLYFFGMGNFIREAGGASDYEAGTNDFPISSSHQTFGFGAGFSKDFGHFFFGPEISYNLNGTTILTDPSDNDTVNINTYKFVSLFFNLGFNLVNSDLLRLYINGGGGVNYTLNADSRTYTSQMGYETQISPPDRKFPLSVFGGTGLDFKISPNLSIILSGRYQYIVFKQPQTMIIALAGIAIFL